MNDPHVAKFHEKINRLKAERDKYRAALEKIRTIESDCYGDCYGYGQCQSVAREALGEK